MSSKKKPQHHSPTSASTEPRPSFFSNAVLLSLTGLLAFLLAYAGWQSYQSGRDSRPAAANDTPPVADSAPPEQTASTPATIAQKKPVQGKWVRSDSDGNYILDIKNSVEDGKLDAAYLNPQPINVARAEADMIDGKLRVFVELRDTNYPGSTYNLRYDADKDQLVGEYFQATQQQRFPVDFQRVK